MTAAVRTKKETQWVQLHAATVIRPECFAWKVGIQTTTALSWRILLVDLAKKGRCWTVQNTSVDKLEKCLAAFPEAKAPRWKPAFIRQSLLWPYFSSMFFNLDFFSKDWSFWTQGTRPRTKKIGQLETRGGWTSSSSLQQLTFFQAVEQGEKKCEEMHEVKERQKIIFIWRRSTKRTPGQRQKQEEKDSQKQAKEEAKKIIQDGDKVGCEIQVWW